MSRLDQHITVVRNKLMLGVFLETLARAGLLLGVVVLIVILGQRILDRAMAHPAVLFWVGVGAAGVGALFYSFLRRPTSEVAAVKIDEALGLKEKFSTALYARPMDDPFARAAVLDAEQSAHSVSLAKRFPIQFPKQAWTTAAVFCAAILVGLFMPTLHWLSKSPAASRLAQAGPPPHHDEFIKPALPTILAPAAMPNASDKIRRAADELNKAIHTDDGDELRNHRSVLSALQDYNKTMIDELKNNEKFETANEERNEMSAIESAKDDSTPIGKAQNELKNGDLDAAMNDISKAVGQFDKMKDSDQQKMIDQAKNLAQELSKAGNDPKAGQKIASQLMQMGATQAQAQRMAATMQQAAQGNKQAQQQLQQMAQQMAQQMNNGQGPTQQQQQQIQQMMTQAQSLANSQVQAQALAQAAQQLSLAMVQARAAGQAHPGAQQQTARPGQASGSQSQQGGQGMQQAQQNMQQQLQNMQANAKDAQAMQAAANAAAQAAADAAAGLNGPNGGDGGGASGENGQGGGNGQARNPGGGGAQGGQGAGGLGKGGAKMGIVMAPATFQQQLDPSKDIQTGKILASRYVKAGIDPGKSTDSLKNVAAAAEKDAADDIDQDHIPREAQQAEKDYFSAMQEQDGQ